MNILDRMVDYIELREGEKFWVSNPVNPGENFADKWNEEEYHQRRENFFLWHAQAKQDFGGLKNQKLPQLGESLKKLLGENVTTRTLNEYAEMARAATKNGFIRLASHTGTLGVAGHTFQGNHNFYGEGQ